MKKYLLVSRLSWRERLQYPVDVLLTALRAIVILIVMYFIWSTLTKKNNNFAGYSFEQLSTYVIFVAALHAIIFGARVRMVANEINEGQLSTYLVKPISYFWFTFFRELPERIYSLLFSIVAVIIFTLIIRPPIFVAEPLVIALFVFSILCSVFLYFVFSFSFSLLAFWSRQMGGPWWLVDNIIEYTSGSFFPLNVFLRPLFYLSTILPFQFMIFRPLLLYLGKINLTEGLLNLLATGAWIVFFLVLGNFIWRKGLRVYSGEGI